MAINGITNMLNNKIRMTGMVSGFDTDTMVRQILTADRLKLDKVIQKRELALWRTESYREITSTFQSFYKEYFDTLSPKNLKSANSYASFSTSYAAAISTDYITVTPGASAKAGTYSITAVKAATAAAISKGNVSKAVEGVEILDSDLASEVGKISSANHNNRFEFTFNNKTIQFSLNEEGNINTVQGLQVELQSKIDDAFGSGKVKVEFTAKKDADGNVIGGKLNFSTVRETDTFSIGTVYNDGADVIFDGAPTEDAPLVLTAANNQFDLTIDGVTKTITVPLENGVAIFGNTNGDKENEKDLASVLQKAVKDVFGEGVDIEFSYTEDGKIKYTSSQPVSISKTANKGIDSMGLSSSTGLSNKLDLNAKIYDIKDIFNEDLSASGTGNDIEFAINGRFFRFNSKNTSINDIMKAVNADTTINVTMKYDVTTNGFKIESKSTGVTSKLTVEDKTGHLMKALGIEGNALGTDASIKIAGIAGKDADGKDIEIEIVRPTNSFTYDGLTFDIKGDFKSGTDSAGKVTDPIKATVSSDTTKTFDFIKGFVDKYNEIIEKLNGKINEKVYRDYQPLTDEQKEAMTEDQIKKWEERAKSGLLKNDSIISSTLASLRTALYSSVEGVGITLTSIGITTSSNYEDRGKLVIDEAKLKEALTTKSEEISKLFTNSSEITYFDAMNSSTARSQRNKESGIANKLSDIIQDAIRTSTDKNGNKGSLLEKAGIIGDRSEFSNVLAKEIMEFDDLVTEMNKKLSAKEDALYKKFAVMESALSKMNSQQSWIAQQFGMTQ